MCQIRVLWLPTDLYQVFKKLCGFCGWVQGFCDLELAGLVAREVRIGNR